MLGYGSMMPGFGGFGLGEGYVWGLGLFGMVIQLIIIFAVLYFAYFLWQKAMRHRVHGFESNHGAKAILAERFARGEISEQEYERMKNLL